MPAATPEILERETQDFLADVELFLEAECEDVDVRRRSASRCRSGVRWMTTRSRSRGRSRSRSTLAAASRSGSPDASTASTRSAPPTFEVLDYKTGGYWRDNWKGVFAGGRRLQHALYGLAAVELLKARYKKPKVRGGRLLLLQPQGAAGARPNRGARAARRSARCWATCAR